MTEPMVTVAVLAVLWLIVVIPMIVQRKDSRAGSRSAARFDAAMRVLSRRSVIDRAAPAPQSAPSTLHVSGAVDRKPTPVGRTATMFVADTTDMSQARRQMMSRRRRALGMLLAGLVIASILAVFTRSSAAWVFAVLFAVSLGGYLLSLHSQTTRDNARRQNRRSAAPPPQSARDYDATSTLHRFTDRPEAVVEIDSDDVSLHNIDTIDLTGLYTDEDLRSDGSDSHHHDLRRAG